MIAELTIPDTLFDGSYETSIQALEFVLDEVEEALRTRAPTLSDRQYLKSCISVEARTAFGVLKDFIRGEVRGRVSEQQLFEFARQFEEYIAVRRGLERAVELLIKLGAVEGTDPFLLSVKTRLAKMSN